MKDYLADVRKDCKCPEAKFSYASQKYRVEIEMPADVGVDDDEYVCTSKIKGARRFQTEHLRELIEKL